MIASAMASRRQNHARPDPAKTMERGFSEEKEMIEDEVMRRPSMAAHRRRMR
jgi:hypothetical protein